jgi:transposase
VPSDPGRRICLSIGVLVSLAARRVWSARVAEREPCLAAHAELVFCEQSIERTIAWIMRNRRMSRDYEFLSETTEALIYVAMIRLMLRRLAKAAS